MKGVKNSWRSACISPLITLFPVGRKSLFEPISQVRPNNLRGSSNNIFIRRPETDAARKSFGYRGAVLWNGLPSEIILKYRCQQFRTHTLQAFLSALADQKS